jgi:uncharacterized protein YndB with AHSA1/START domain
VSETIVTEVELDEPPAKVWRALTEPDLIDRWLPAGPLAPPDREVIESDPERSLRVLWRGPEIESEVAFEITETDAGSRLRITHGGFRRAVACNDNVKLRSAA